MPLVYEVVFSIAVISRIKSIGDGRVGEGGWWGQLGSRKRAKAGI